MTSYIKRLISVVQQNRKPLLLLVLVVALGVMYMMQSTSAMLPVQPKAATLPEAEIHDDDTAHLIRGDEFPLERDGLIPSLSARRDQQ